MYQLSKYTIFALLWIPNSILAQEWSLASNAEPMSLDHMDNAGVSTAIEGSIMVMGASADDMDDEAGQVNESGAVYVYELDEEGNWLERQKLFSPNAEVLGYFGQSVAVHQQTIFVGAYGEDLDQGAIGNAGRVYQFSRNNNGLFMHVATLVAPDPGQADLFGFSIDVSENHLLIGAYNHQFDLEGDHSLSGAGAAYIYQLQNNQWNFLQKIVASNRAEDDNFAKFLDISSDKIIIGAEDNDQAFKFDAGAAYIFEFDANLNLWTESQKLVASDASAFKDFGWDVAIHGDHVLVGASAESNTPDGQFNANAGAVYYFKKNAAGNWIEKQKIFAPDYTSHDFFGRSIDMEDGYAIIGSDMEDEDGEGENTISGAGSAYVIKLINDQWTFSSKVIGTDRKVDDLFGGAVAMSLPYIVVGAWRRDKSDAEGNILIDAGAAYIFYQSESSTPSIYESDQCCLNIYPNPSEEFLHIIAGTQEQFKTIIVRNMQGRKVQELDADQTIFNLSNLPAGLYLIQLNTSQNHIWTGKWLKY